MAEGEEFRATGAIEVFADPASIRDARREIEEGLGDVTVGVQAEGGGSGGAISRTLDDQTGALETIASATDTREDQLGEIIDILDDAAGGAGGGGGGDRVGTRPRRERPRLS